MPSIGRIDKTDRLKTIDGEKNAEYIWVHLLQVVGIAGALGTLIIIYDSVRCWSDPGRCGLAKWARFLWE
jgi:hypothetical protein